MVVDRADSENRDARFPIPRPGALAQGEITHRCISQFYGEDAVAMFRLGYLGDRMRSSSRPA